MSRWTVRRSHDAEQKRLRRNDETYAALEKAGLPSIRFHDLRHTTATFMLQNAVPAKIVSAMLGHSSIGITMDTYSHVLTDMQEGATSKMNTLLKKLY